MVAYAWALQHWAEQNNLPARGEPCLLARSVLELREGGKMVPLLHQWGGFLGGGLSPKKKRKRVCRPLALLTYLRHPVCLSQHQKEEPQSLWDGRRCRTHPDNWWPLRIFLDQPGPQGLKVGANQISQMIPMKPPVSPPRIPTPPQPSPSMQALALMQLLTPPHGFSGVTACVCAPELVEVELEAPVGIVPMGLLSTPGITSISSSHIVERRTYGSNLYGHCHNLCWEGDHQWSRSRSPFHQSYNRGHHR